MIEAPAYIEVNNRWVQGLKLSSLACGLIVFFIALFSFMISMNYIPGMQLIRAENVKPVASIGFMLLSLCFFLVYKEYPHPIAKYFYCLLGTIIVGFSLVRLIEKGLLHNPLIKAANLASRA